MALVSPDSIGLSAFWSQRLLVDCSRRALITAEHYYAFISALAQERYHFVQIDSQYLLRLMRQHNLTLAPEVVAGISLLSDPACSINSAVNVASGVVAACWVNPIQPYFRHMVLDAVLGALTQNRAAQVVLQALTISLVRTLGPRSPATMEIAQIIKLWKRILFS